SKTQNALTRRRDRGAPDSCWCSAPNPAPLRGFFEDSKRAHAKTRPRGPGFMVVLCPKPRPAPRVRRRLQTRARGGARARPRIRGGAPRVLRRLKARSREDARGAPDSCWGSACSSKTQEPASGCAVHGSPAGAGGGASVVGAPISFAVKPSAI